MLRGMAQLGSASALGAEGPRFKSGYPDHTQPAYAAVGPARPSTMGAVATSAGVRAASPSCAAAAVADHTSRRTPQ